MPPTVQRTFEASGQLTVRARVYASRGDATVVTLVLNAPDGTSTPVALTRTPLDGVPDGADYAGQVALDGRRRGRYVLVLSAADPSSNRPAVQRSVAITVR